MKSIFLRCSTLANTAINLAFSPIPVSYTHLDVYKRQALEYEKMGELEQAYAYFEKLIVDFADYLPTYLLYGNFLEKIGEEEKAKNIYENGMLLAQKQNNSKAMQEIERALFLL